MDLLRLTNLLGDFFLVLLYVVDCPLEVVDGAVDVLDELLLLPELSRQYGLALSQLIGVHLQLVDLALELPLCDCNLLQLRFFLLHFALEVGDLLTLLDADVAVLPALLADLAYLRLEVCDQVLKRLLLLRFFLKEFVFLINQLLLKSVVEGGVLLVPRLPSLMVLNAEFRMKITRSQVEIIAADAALVVQIDGR